MDTPHQQVPEQTPKERPDRKRRLRSRLRSLRTFPFFRIFLLLGPGLIAANAGNDAGGIATYSSMGASFGFQMLWVMLVLLVGVSIVQEMCARMGAATGKGLSDLIRENFPIRLTAFIALTFFIANTGVVISEFIGIAAALSMLGIPNWIGAPIGGLFVWLLITRGSYQKVEKVFLFFTLAFFAYIIAAFLARPDWGQVMVGTFVPTIQFNGAFIGTLIVAVGTTISPYMQIYIQSATVERGVTMNNYKYARLDVYTGSLFSILVAYFIIVATGATLFVSSGGQGVALDSAAQAATALVPFLGDFALYAFALGLLGASLLAASVLPLTTCYAVTEILGLENSVSRRWKDAPTFWTLFTVLIIISVIVASLPGLQVVDILLNLYLLNGILLPIILFSILHLVNKKRLMGRHTNNLFLNILAYTLATFVSLLAIAYVLSQILGFFGIHIFA